LYMYICTTSGECMLAYLFLLGAIASEVVGTSLLKSTDGFTRLWATVGCISAYAVSFAALSQAVKSVPVSVAYALWSALGTVAIVTIGVAFLGEGITPVKVSGLALVITGVVLLNLGGAH
jgi:small multidrug resistance pump